MTLMSYQFEFNHRLGISLPVLDKEWEDYSLEDQDQILVGWETHRSDIPARIKEVEQIIEHRQSDLNHEDNFQHSCEINSKICELASIINDLNIWFRIQQDTDRKVHNLRP